MKIRLKVLFATLMVLLLLLSACSSDKETIKYEGDPAMKATLKVMSIESERQIMEEYGDLFKAKYPNIELEIVNYQWRNTASLNKVLEEEKPDVFSITSNDEYEQFIQDNRMYDLSALLSNRDFDLEGIHPEVINYLRKVGDGKIYGIPSSFLSKAIYYNKDLFDKYGIPYPKDQMTWEEVIQLAKRFPSEDGISGLYMRNFSDFVNDMAWVSRINPVSEKDLAVTLNTESYRKIFELILDGYQTKAVNLPDIDLFEVYDPFITGTSAMTVDYYYYINNNINWATEEKGDQFHLNWDVVSSPVDEFNRDISPYFRVSGIVAINAESGQKQAAWELVKFINSEQLAKAKSRTVSVVVPTRTDYIYNPEGKRMEAFYNLKPDVNRKIINYNLFPNRFFGNLDGIINSEGKAVMVGVKTLDEAIASMQERGQRLLDQK